MPTVYVEDGMDSVQNELREKWEQNQERQEMVKNNPLGFLMLWSLKREQKQIEEKYRHRAWVLGLPGGHG